MENRSELADYADELLLKAREYASPNHALITFPGEEGGYGTRVDGLEGFARTFLLAGFRIAGESGNDPYDYASWYGRGIAAGVDPDSPERWIRPTEHDQAKVEAASIALILDMTRPWIWDKVDRLTQQRVIEYLTPIVGDETYPKNNWLWFRVVVQTFLKSVGGPYSLSDIRKDLEAHQSYVRADGWYSDGPARAYDHYIGWAMHLYPALWSRMQGAEELIDPDLMSEYFRMLERYLQDTVHLIGANGSPLIQGRSLIYRYAAAAQYWVGAYAGVKTVPLQELRACAMAVITHFAERTDDILTMGWHHEWRKMAQSYSGPGSPYWAAKGMLGLALPSDHPVWTTPGAKLPVSKSDALFTIASPGWIVSSTKDDGIVRVINHGTDCGQENQPGADSPLYARFGYSTHTAPLLGDDAWENPLEQAVVLLDEAGHASHRSGMSLFDLRQEDGVGIAASGGDWHWISGKQTQVGHGQGLKGGLTKAGSGIVVSLVRGAAEIRLARVEALDPHAKHLRFGGWALAGIEGVEDVTARNAAVSCNGLLSKVALCEPQAGAETGVTLKENESMLAKTSYVPWLSLPAVANQWAVVALTLAGTDCVNNLPQVVEVVDEPGAVRIRVTWPDMASTEHTVVLD